MRIESPQARHTPSLWRIWRESFGDSDESIGAFWKTAFSSDRARVALENDIPVAALYWFDCEWMGEKMAYLYAIATDQAFRGRGICNQLMRDTHQHLRKLGYAGAMLVPAEERLFDFYRKMGYETVCTIDEIDCSAEEGTLPLTEIDREKFAALRRVYLPNGSVIQEGETLDFLDTWVSFWKGDGLLLAASRHKGILVGAEVLGDLSQLSRAVTTLGCQRGHFRTVGDARPFAMLLPLRENLTAPVYFGLALD